MRLRSVHLVLLVALFAVCASAQEYRGRIQGTVTDTSQGAVMGATVTLANVNTGVKSNRQTNESGHYLFDMVEPGTYSITVELTGFNTHQQSNIALNSRGDVSVDVALKVGSISEKITVESSVTAVQFNTSKVETTVSTRLADTLPQMHRNPFLLAQLDPSVEKNDGNTEYEPYHTWGANQQRIGGGANYANDLQVDGSPVTIGLKTSYVPSPDSVQEVTVQQNAIDAEYGHSSGSAISIVLKSGTNDWHGNTFYQGQYPWANALEDRVYRTINKGRIHMFGASLGNPIIKNKLFNYFAWEQWKKIDPQNLVNTLPTDLERQGDFSQSLNGSGGLRTIYDPWSTQTNGDVVTRTPFADNKIPTNRQDRVATMFMPLLWQPNRAGYGPYHQDNYYSPLPISYAYKNITDRVDYNLSEKLRMFGRLSFIRTPVTTSNPTGSEIFVSDRGSQRDATSYSGDVVYTISPTTVLNIHGDFHAFVDDATSPNSLTDANGWSKWWPNSTWYKPLFANESLPVFIPRMLVMRDPGQQLVNMGMGAGFWYQHPDGNSFNIKLAQQRGSHYIKYGFDTRANRAQSYVAESPGFGFLANTTASTYINPDLSQSGDGYATFLLGAVENGGWGWGGGQSSFPIIAMKRPATRFFAGFLNDDWKVSRNLTLNLGLRYEYEQPYRDPENRLSRALDLTSPIPEMQGANAPVMPALVSKYYTGPTIYNGAFQFTDGNNRGMWNSVWGVLSPRVGAAYRLNDKMALRVAWARYALPWVQDSSQSYLDVPYPGYDSTTIALNALQGVPQQHLSDPFPASNPLIAPTGNSLGRYTGLGESVGWSYAARPKVSSDRFNVSWQRQLPNDIIFDATYLLNWTHGMNSTQNLNMFDPRLSYQYKGELNQTVANPFYNFSTPDKFPGSLRYQEFVGLGSLMKPYPQYGDLNENQTPGGSTKYQSLQMKLQKSFSKGYTFLGAYNYHRQNDTIFYDDIATYLRDWSWQGSDASRHRLSLAGTWDLPFGHGRTYMSAMPRALDLALGGWNLNGIYSWRTGRYVRFGTLQVTGNPVVDSQTRDRMFDASVFKIQPDYTPRNNPYQYDGLTGPSMLNLDMSLVKSFRFTEKIRSELQMQAFNALNSMTPNDPDTNISSVNFGKSVYQLGNTYGRRVQLGMKIVF